MLGETVDDSMDYVMNHDDVSLTRNLDKIMESINYREYSSFAKQPLEYVITSQIQNNGQELVKI